MGSTGNPHVALIAFPFGTHAAPLFSLTAALATAAPSATFSFINSGRSNASLARDISAVPSGANIRVYDISDGCPDGYVLPVHNPEEEVGLFLQAAAVNIREAMEKAVEGAGGRRISCIVSDAFIWFAGKMAEEMRVPWVPLWTGGPYSLATHMYTDFLRLKFGEQVTPSRLSEPLDCIPYMSALQVRELPEGIVFGNTDSVFARLVHSMAKELPHATTVALNTFHGLDPAVDADLDTKFKHTLSIGPLHLLTPQPPQPADSYGCVQWLDNHAPATVVYISFGTIMSLPPPEAAALAEGLEASGVPFIWSLKAAGQAYLPSGFLERTSGRGLVVPWVPQLKVLNHPAVGAFVTHCGWNSVMESVTGGVPMICRPFLGDQRLNAGVVSRVWKIGAGFEGGIVTTGAAEKALRLVLMEDGGKAMRERVGKLREMAIGATKPGESSTNNFQALVEVICGY
uniref:Glycosyltransferase n=1 Tax=Erythronium umbilicatum TaxID=202160 RepID=A0A977IVM9_9LILI|nr:UDP-glucose:flavonoid 3-o-glucosyltransferase [Erythronium umbilicatum]UWK01866.1 UDP-glucose:flavonoid 3-o-glucosyltransferase [Erythronium umbilicatum]